MRRLLLAVLLLLLPAPVFALCAWQAVGAQASALASVSCTWPTHQTDDIGVLLIEVSGGDTLPTPPSGWTNFTGSPLADVADATGSKLYVMWIRATSAAMANPATSDSGDHQGCRLYTFRGCLATGDPFDVVNSATKTTASTTATAPDVTTTVADTLVLLVASRPNDNSNTAHFGVFVNSNLANIAEAGEAGYLDGNGGGFVLGYGDKATAGAVGTSTSAKIASTTDVTFTIALKQAAAASAIPLRRIVVTQ